MWPMKIIIFHEFGNSQSELVTVISRIQVDILLFYGTPETFYPDIVLTSPPSVHADTDIMALQTSCPFFTSVLASLIGIENIRCSVSADAIFKKSRAVAGRKIIAESPAYNEAAIDINNSIQVHEAVFDRNIGYIRTPYSIRTVRLEVAQQIGMYVFCLTTPGQTFTGIHTFYTHDLHQTTDTLMVYPTTAKTEYIRELLHSCSRMFQNNPVYFFHHIQISLRLTFRTIIVAAAGYVHLLAEMMDAYPFGKLPAKSGYLTFSPASSQALAKKSFSMVNSPTFFKRRSFSALRWLNSFSREVSGLTNAALALARNSCFQAVIFTGETSNSLANSVKVFCSLMASKATLALKEASNLLFRPILNPFFYMVQRYKIFFNFSTCTIFGV